MLAGDVYVPDCLQAPDGGEGRADRRHVQRNLLNGLTERQCDVARLLGQGFTNRAIGSMLGLTEGTVKVHVTAIFRVLEVSNRTGAVGAMQRLPQT